MRIERITEVETADIKIGDRVYVDHYTATCQTVTPKGALFLLDQYLDEPTVMNVDNTNQGGYKKSDLRKALQSEWVLGIFAGIRDYMVPFDNGDLLRIPFVGEMFDKPPKWCEPDDHKQWPLMQDRRNRLASRCGEYEWGWINNKRKSSATSFCYVSSGGYANSWNASYVFGVRPVFQIAKWEDKKPTLEYGGVNPDCAYKACGRENPRF